LTQGRSKVSKNFHQAATLFGRSLWSLPRRWGLRFEIVVSLALLVAAAAGLMGLLVLKYAQREMIALKIETGLVLAKAIEEKMALPAEQVGLERLLHRLTEAGFEKIVLMDPAGRVLASSESWPWSEPPAESDLRQAMAARQVRTSLAQPLFFMFGPDPSLALAVPLFSDLKLLGAAGLYSPLTDLKASWKKTKEIILIYLVLDTLITVLFGTYLLSRRLVEPLARMLGRIKALAEGAYQPGDHSGIVENEIGQLEEAFEVMAGRLLESRARLEQNLTSLQQAQEGLIRSEKMVTVGRLAAGLAHELGNPLGAVLGFVHLLRDSDLPESTRLDFLQRMENELSRMDAIIRALLDFARPAKTKPEAVDLNQIVADGLALTEVQKWRQGLEVTSEAAPELPPARGEANRLTQVLLNLLANAGQAMSGRGRLTVATGRKGDEVFMTVSDNGPGIAEEDLPHIFEPFFTRKEPGQGTGLGLSVSLSIVESFGGRIEVQSQPDQGATFTVFLPIWEESGEQ